MPKDYFKREEMRSLDQLAPGAAVHVIGVCGVAMAQIAVELTELGYTVSGSDKEFYEPMGSLLKNSRVRLCSGYRAENVPGECALAIIGNAVVYENPEVLAVETRRIPYSIFPKLLHDTVIAGKHSVVVTGTHGKSTTTAMAAVVFERCGLDPGYFIGGAMRDLAKSLHRGGGSISVVEGDEYDSSFFAKVPKFSFYEPDTAIVTSLEYDHADIYPDLASIDRQFDGMISGLSSERVAICNTDSEHLRSLVAGWKKSARCRVVTYGSGDDAEYRLVRCESKGETQQVDIRGPHGDDRFTLNVPGRHNAANALAVYAAAHLRGIPLAKVRNALRQFHGVRRRQEVRWNEHGLTVIEDFAHHPTAVRETISATRAAYPGRRLWAVFEPRSNTSRRRVFKDDYVGAFAQADQVVLCEVQARSSDSAADLLSVGDLSGEITKSGVSSQALPDAEAIRGFLNEAMVPGDVVLIMSNGAFGGLIEKVLGDLRLRRG